MTSELAPMLAKAKINLYLHVAAPDARGYHPLQSLVVFADIGDTVSLEKSETSQESLISGLSISGPFSEGLSPGEDNLVMKAVRRFEAATGRVTSHRIHLTKNLPIASGIGGGSADAGAVLRLLRTPEMTDGELDEIAAETGADGVMCLRSQPAIAAGYGEKLTPVSLPQVAAVLVNPLVDCSTARVYAGYDEAGKFGEIDAAGAFQKAVNMDQLITALSHTRNDLQAPAIRLRPVIAEVLTALEAQDETRFARMSGSGATCYALCACDEAAAALSVRMQAMLPGAWVRACRLG